MFIQNSCNLSQGSISAIFLVSDRQRSVAMTAPQSGQHIHTKKPHRPRSLHVKMRTRARSMLHRKRPPWPPVSRVRAAQKAPTKAPAFYFYFDTPAPEMCLFKTMFSFQLHWYINDTNI
jgi:hypothetical protein